jgi:hypothetical protein
MIGTAVGVLFLILAGIFLLGILARAFMLLGIVIEEKERQKKRWLEGEDDDEP